MPWTIRSNTHVCGSCNGAGARECPTCYGRGKYATSGMGNYRKCLHCRGGRITCRRCDGTGYVTHRKRVFVGEPTIDSGPH